MTGDLILGPGILLDVVDIYEPHIIVHGCIQIAATNDTTLRVSLPSNTNDTDEISAPIIEMPNGVCVNGSFGSIRSSPIVSTASDGSTWTTTLDGASCARPTGVTALFNMFCRQRHPSCHRPDHCHCLL